MTTLRSPYESYQYTLPPRLIVGQILRRGNELWRVVYVSDCRARIVPLSKRKKDNDFDADERGGISIATNSWVEIVTDLDRVRTEIELAETEAEIRATKKELKNREQQATVDSQEEKLRKLEAEIAELERAEKKSTRPVSAGGWYRTNVEATFKPGSLGDTVMKFIVANPGQTTAQIVEGVVANGAIAACVSRFNQAGLIEKR